MWNTVPQIVHYNLGWTLASNESHRLENLIIGTGLVDYRNGGYYQEIKLTASGRNILSQFLLYSKYEDSLMRQNKVEQENENLKINNVRLQNKLLELQLSNKDLDRDLKMAQYFLTEQQRKELRNKRWWAFWAAIGTLALTQLVEHGKEIWKLLHR